MTLSPYTDKLAGLSSVYPAIAADMIAKGWQVVWATQNSKDEWTPLPGTTGGRSTFPSNKDMPQGKPVRIAFRPPEDVKILDVDHYGEKLGWHTIERAEEDLGLLPPTWKVSSRGAADRSGRYLYRVRDGLNFKDRDLWKFRDPESGATSVEVVRTDHRFSWAVGDVNPKNDQLVQVYGPTGELTDMPSVNELPYLPEEWQEFLADAPQPKFPQPSLFFSTEDTPEWWKQIPDSCMGTRDELARIAFDMLLAGADPDLVVDELLRISVALDLARPWTKADVTGLIDANTQAKVYAMLGEWNSIMEFTVPDPERRRQLTEDARHDYETRKFIAESRDRAAAIAALGDPADFVNDEGVITDTDTFRTVVIGDHEFDPQGADDTSLGLAVLERINGAVYCADSAQWLVWGQDRWKELTTDLLDWAVLQLSLLMPYGEANPDPEDPDGPVKKRQAKNRMALAQASSTKGVVTKARAALAIPGMHKLSINRADVDANPNVIWGGGRCWNILASTSALVYDPAEQGTPHLMTADCEPVEMEIPGFWALVNAILPDPVSRDYWLDMMARGLLGHQTKRTIPLAVGPTKRGKTLLLERLPFGTYMSQVSGQDLLGSGDREEARRLNVLVGKRLPYVDEGISQGKIAQGRLKKITSGGQRLPARGIFGKEFEFKPTHTLVMLVNEEEEPTYTDDAVKERFCRVEFNGDPEDIKKIAGFYEPGSDLWEKETPGVLAFFIRRAAEIVASKSDRGTSFDKPLQVTTAQDAVAREQDPVLDWLEQCCEVVAEGGQGTLVGTLYDHYLEYIKNRRIPTPTPRSFGISLSKHGVGRWVVGGGKNMRGLAIKQVWSFSNQIRS